MLKLRILTALIGLPFLIVGLIWLPKIYICLFFLGCVCFSVYEAGRMLYPAFLSRTSSPPIEGKKTDISSLWPWFCVLAACLMYVVATMVNLSATERGGIIATFTVVMLVGTFSGKNIEQSVFRMASVLVSLCYGCLPWLSVWDLYLMGSHARYVFLLLAVVMMGDSAAYFAGLHLGKTPLAPTLSPKKTWEGVIGGLIASVLGTLVMNALFGNSLGPGWLMVVVAIVAGLVGVMGDLVESALKRFAGVKDSGSIFPGHGGFLDRVDAILFAAPMVWLILYSYASFAR